MAQNTSTYIIREVLLLWVCLQVEISISILCEHLGLTLDFTTLKLLDSNLLQPSSYLLETTILGNSCQDLSSNSLACYPNKLLLINHGQADSNPLKKDQFIIICFMLSCMSLELTRREFSLKDQCSLALN